MSDVTQQFLEKLSRMDSNSKLNVSGRVFNVTREGSYIKIQMGLSSATYFVGRDLENDKLIVEDVS